jgi:hypothetical protein
MIEKFIAVVVVVLMLVTACPAAAQETTATTTAAEVATTTTTATTAPATATVTEPKSSSEVRTELYSILRSLPPEVPKVLKLDPTLWHNQSYIGNYPVLAAFVAQHPEIPRNPRYFLEDVWLPNDPIPQTPAMELWDNFLEGVAVASVVASIAIALMWILRTILNHRRWSRLARVQTEVHTKLLDRFSSNEELMAYINTTAGKKFLEAAPIPVQEAAPSQITAPLNRVLWSLQAGVVLGAASLGMVVVSWSADKEVAGALTSFGILGLAVGIGFIASAGISLFLSRRLGLWSPPPRMTDTAAE